jgi:hypothetical protein
MACSAVAAVVRRVLPLFHCSSKLNGRGRLKERMIEDNGTKGIKE